MRTLRHDQDTLTKIAFNEASPEQKAKLGTLTKFSWKVTKIIHAGSRCAICLGTKDEGAWLTPDGVFHRRVKGKKHVSINTTTLERIW